MPKLYCYDQNCTTRAYMRFPYINLFRTNMRVEVSTFHNGDLMVKVVFEPDSNFWKETLTWVPSVKEIELILNSLLGIDAVNRWKRHRKSYLGK